jgi:hypothetical protein
VAPAWPLGQPRGGFCFAFAPRSAGEVRDGGEVGGGAGKSLGEASPSPTALGPALPWSSQWLLVQWTCPFVYPDTLEVVVPQYPQP